MQYFDAKEYGKRIKELRELRGIKAEDLAVAVGYSDVRSIRRLEAGDSAGKIDKLMEVSQALNISTDYLLFGKMQEAEGNEITEFLSNKTLAEKEFAMKMLESIFANKKLLIS